ncbi:hypothetical protein [Vibrio sp. 10N]|uniref:hypothetical protein n=1 Tax=Vibrio sp. 10N TaxID=3058938 RepID=UPI002812F99B|nr:hypothetical protein VB10N_28940 [Vibrio sp. 10N]
MFDEVIFHIGAPKTGTTTIQDFLALNRDSLFSHGISIPGCSKNHQFLVSKFSNAPEELDFNRSAGRTRVESVVWHDSKLTDFLSKTGNSKKLLFSSEHLVLLKEDEINALLSLFKRKAKKLTVLVYVRNPFDWASSGVQEAVKNGEQTLEQAIETPNFMIFHNLIDRWVSVFGDKRVKVRKLECPDLLSDFCKTLKLPDIAYLRPPADLNTSLSQEAIFIANELSKVLPKFSEGRAPQDMISKLLKKIKGNKFYFLIPENRQEYQWIKNDLVTLNLKYKTEYFEKRINHSAIDYDKDFIQSLALLVNETANQLYSQ